MDGRCTKRKCHRFACIHVLRNLNNLLPLALTHTTSPAPDNAVLTTCLNQKQYLLTTQNTTVFGHLTSLLVSDGPTIPLLTDPSVRLAGKVNAPSLFISFLHTSHQKKGAHQCSTANYFRKLSRGN